MFYLFWCPSLTKPIRTESRFCTIFDQSFRHRWLHVRGLMWTDVIVLSEPLIDDDLGLLCRHEPLGIEYLTAQRSIEAFVVLALPG